MYTPRHLESLALYSIRVEEELCVDIVQVYLCLCLHLRVCLAGETG